MKIILKYIIGWFGLVALAILNGTIREKGYQPFLSELTAHQLSTFIALILFGIYIFILTSIWNIESSGQALAIGGIWLIFTIAFEFVFGHFVMGHTWSRLFHDYNLFKGRIWVLVFVWLTIAPYVFYRLRF